MTPVVWSTHVPAMSDAKDKLARLNVRLIDVSIVPLHIALQVDGALSNGATSLLSDLATGTDLLGEFKDIPGAPDVPSDDMIRTLVDQFPGYCSTALSGFLQNDLPKFIPNDFSFVRDPLKNYVKSEVRTLTICSTIIDALYVGLADIGASRYKSGHSCFGAGVTVEISDLSKPPKITAGTYDLSDSSSAYPGCIHEQLTMPLPHVCSPGEVCVIGPTPSCNFLCAYCQSLPQLCTPDAIHFGADGADVLPASADCKWSSPFKGPPPPQPKPVTPAPKPHINQPPRIVDISPVDGAVVPNNQPTLTVSAVDEEHDPLEYEFTLTGDQVDISRPYGPSNSWTIPAQTLDPAEQYTWTVKVRDTYGKGKHHETPAWVLSFTVHWMPTAASLVSTPNGRGYWTVDTKGTVGAFGTAKNYGSLSDIGIHVENIIGMARTVDGLGYWLVGSDGGVFSFGDARFYGSMGGKPLNGRVVGMSPTRDGKGYWLVAADGGVFSFGNAKFYGSMGGKPLNAPVVAMGVTPDSGGYWLAAKDGGVFSFGNAHFYGSMGGKHLNAPVSAMAAHPSGRGYWLAAEDGGVFTFGEIHFYGSMAGHHLNGHIVGMETTSDGRGYWLLGCDGGIFTFGDAAFHGSNPTFACRGYPVP